MRIKTLLGFSLLSVFLFSCGSSNDLTLPTLNTEIHQLEKKLKSAKQSKDYISAAELQFELNYKTELENAKSDPDEEQRIHRKYEILSIVLKDEIQVYEENQELHPIQNLAPSQEMPSILNGIGMETANQVYDAPSFTSAYHPLALEEVKKVFKDFGPLYINETFDEKGRPGQVKVTALTRPWAGYWYPFTDKSLYTSKIETVDDPKHPGRKIQVVKELSPLGKLDLVYKKKNIISNLVEEEVKRFEGFHPDGWEGLCGGRAYASVIVPEPTAPIVVEGVRFSIADQKALHTFAHLSYSNTVYGVVYRGTAETDGTYQDIKPEAFHQLVMAVVGKEQRAFVIDDTAGPPVWNKPLYSYQWKIEKDPKYDFAFNVKARAFLVKERSKEETDILTGAPGTDDIMAPTYTYRLYVDKKDVKDGKYRVIAGQWTGESFRDHPDTVSYLHKNGEPKSHSEIFNKNISLYKSIFTNFSSLVR